MSVARTITQRMASVNRVRTKDAIYTVVTDDHNVHCMTADMLDAWWNSLTPERKAIFFEADLDGLLDEVVMRPSSEAPAFQQHVDQFFADMNRENRNPLAGLMQEGTDASL